MLKGAQELTGGVKRAQSARTVVVAGVVKMPSKIVTTPNAAEMTYELTAPAAGGDKTFIIGDPTGAGAAAIGGTLLNPNSVNGKSSLVLPNKEMFGLKGIVFGGINLETSSDKSQFNNQLKIYAVNHNGDLNLESVAFKGSKMGNQYDPLVMNVDVEFVLDPTRFIVITVKDGETLSLTTKPSIYAK